LPDGAQLNEAIERPDQVIGRNMLLQAETEEERLLPDLPLAHHGRPS
jgi:hypothetical protein